MFRSLLVLGFVSLAAAHGSQAQQDTTGLVPGRRIRIHQGGLAMVGTFLSADSSTMAIVTSGADTVRVLRTGVTGIDVSIGTKSNAGKGALTGLLIGGLSGAVLGLVAGLTEDKDSFVYIGPGAAALGLGVTFGALGAGIGALSGSGKRTDKWAPTAWPTVSYVPGGLDGGRVKLGMHLTF